MISPMSDDTSNAVPARLLDEGSKRNSRPRETVQAPATAGQRPEGVHAHSTLADMRCGKVPSASLKLVP